MKSIVEQSHMFLLPALHRQAICVDATLGHGKDALFFIQNKVKKVIGFEIQKDVFETTLAKFESKTFTGILDGHENMDRYINEDVDAIIFNFGYCPGATSNIMTSVSTSVEAIQKGLVLLKKKGRMALVVYPHKEGKQEAQVIEEYLRSLDSNVFYIEKRMQLNQTDSPYLIGIEKLH